MNKAKRRKNSNTVRKLIYQKNDVVYAAYWPEHDVDRLLEPSFYKGIILTSSLTNDIHIRREYTVAFEDGYVIDNIPESMIFLIEEYNLRMLHDREDDLPWHGEVKFENDEYSTDDWFKNTGWYSIKINGHQKHYPLLLYALLAYDGNELNICKINKINVDMSKLNLPNLYCNEVVNNPSEKGEHLITNYLPPPRLNKDNVNIIGVSDNMPCKSV